MNSDKLRTVQTRLLGPRSPAEQNSRPGLSPEILKAPGQGGMSLIEVLIATALLAGALLALCSLFFLGMRNNMAAKHDTLMASHIQDKMEELKLNTLAQLLMIQTAVETPDPDEPIMDYYVEGEGWKSTLDSGDVPLYRREWEVHEWTLLNDNKDPNDFNNPVLVIWVRCYAYKYKKNDQPRVLEMRTFRRRL